MANTQKMSANSVKADGRGVDRTMGTPLDEAEGIVGRYVDVTRDSEIRHAVNIDSLVTQKCIEIGWDPKSELDRTNTLRALKKLMKERSVNEMTRLGNGPVVLDLKGEHGRTPWFSVTHPMIQFCALTSSDRLLANAGDDPTTKNQAMAVYFNPLIADKYNYTDKYTGEIRKRASTIDANGYAGIVGFFPTVADAEQARADLAQAVNFIVASQDRTDEEHDPVRDAISDPVTPRDALSSF